MLWSLSPFGEAKVGIPYGVLNGVNIYLVFVACFFANVLVFPIMYFFLTKVNKYLLKWHYYKKSAIYVARKAKVGSGVKIKNLVFFGFFFLVCFPFPEPGFTLVA